MRRFIPINQVQRKALCEKFNVDRSHVWRALNFVGDSEVNSNIRKEAIKMGARLMEEDFVPNCHTQHNSEFIIQTFPCGVVVKTSKNDGRASLLIENEVAETFEGVTLSSWGNILDRAERISKKRSMNI